ncbi:MAG: type II toxin-antitoxin system RelE/ParE family toxin [Tannerella sp.]|jgi:plasmid stabilization system protein ParE|nr:type II toxin-antitoxin system RelE/ParE family toxin [Tannerella sp.]
MVKVRWTDFALENLSAVGDFIERDSSFYAQRVVGLLFSSVDILEQHPLAGRIVPEFNDKTIRELIRGNYRIVYKLVTEADIDIVTVHHSARLLRILPDEE